MKWESEEKGSFWVWTRIWSRSRSRRLTATRSRSRSRSRTKCNVRSRSRSRSKFDSASLSMIHQKFRKNSLISMVHWLKALTSKIKTFTIAIPKFEQKWRTKFSTIFLLKLSLIYENNRTITLISRFSTFRL